MKPAPSGSGMKKKPFYLAEAMQFTIPYIKTLSLTTGNVPNIPEENETKNSKKMTTYMTHNHYHHLNLQLQTFQ